MSARAYLLAPAAPPRHQDAAAAPNARAPRFAPIGRQRSRLRVCLRALSDFASPYLVQELGHIVRVSAHDEPNVAPRAVRLHVRERERLLPA